MDGGPGFLPGGAHCDAFAGGQAVRLDHNRMVTGFNIVQGRAGGLENPVAGAGHAGGVHHGAGEAFAGFQPRRGLRRAEGRYAGGGQAVGQAQGQRLLRADDRQVAGVGPGGGNDAVKVGIRNGEIGSEARRSRIARRRE